MEDAGGSVVAVSGGRFGVGAASLDPLLGIPLGDVPALPPLVRTGPVPTDRRSRGCFFTQVQLRKKTGNRWLFKLGAHPLDAIVAMLEAAFGTVYLVTGVSAASVIRRSYADDSAPSEEDMARVVALYDRPLAHHVRAQDVLRESPSFGGRVFTKLVGGSSRSVLGEGVEADPARGG